MSREAIDKLVERWMEDTTFRAAVRKDPDSAIQASGFELTEAEWSAVRSLDWSLSDEELSARASKGGCVADGSL